MTITFGQTGPSLSLDCDVQFPISIGDVIKEISTSLVQSKKGFHGGCRYYKIIHENRGLNRLVSAAMLAVDNEMINLQGKVVTTNE
jgi:hypothetical protein